MSSLKMMEVDEEMREGKNEFLLLSRGFSTFKSFRV
jgi:hypothetical protein